MPGEVLIRCAKQINNRIILFLYGAGVLIAIVSSFHKPGGSYYQEWGREFSFFAFASSIQYFIAGEAAFLAFWVSRSYKKNITNTRSRPLLWLFAAAGFFYATLDEWFMIHEKALTALDNSVPWLKHLYFNAADDMFVISCGIGALVFTALMLKELRPVKQALYFHMAGLVLLIWAGLLDYLPWHSFEGRLPLGQEELAEYFAGASFAIAFLTYSVDRLCSILARWLQAEEPSDKEDIISTAAPVTQS